MHAISWLVTMLQVLIRGFRLKQTEASVIALRSCGSQEATDCCHCRSLAPRLIKGGRYYSSTQFLIPFWSHSGHQSPDIHSLQICNYCRGVDWIGTLGSGSIRMCGVVVELV